MRRRDIAFVFAAITAFFTAYALLQIAVPVRLNAPVEIKIPEGTNFTAAANALADNGLIRDRVMFVLIGRLGGMDKKLKAGYYSFGGSVTGWYIYKALIKGYILTRSVTVVEGDSLMEIKEKLAAGGIMTGAELERLSKDKPLMLKLGVDAPSLEGYLFPDTYILPKGIDPEAVVKIMVQRLREQYGQALREKAAGMGMNEREVLTLASIIEKEASVDHERPIISAVYHNRLKKGMPLQADPTCIYGAKPMSEGVTAKDLKRKSDYNTYIIKGLPPGPIASPGLKSIEAALSPVDVPFIYFVSNRDGTHTFSASGGDHLRAVDYIKNRKAGKGEKGGG
ncbi:MAG: endolytic transglycosylase MltG [Thermodesulfovibrionales bacterium]|nr:endolytic transglycosylase MltG [Thermodesulfovibrionales bacterium]